LLSDYVHIVLLFSPIKMSPLGTHFPLQLLRGEILFLNITSGGPVKFPPLLFLFLIFKNLPIFNSRVTDYHLKASSLGYFYFNTPNKRKLEGEGLKEEKEKKVQTGRSAWLSFFPYFLRMVFFPIFHNFLKIG